MKRATENEDLHFIGGTMLGASFAALLMFWTNCQPPDPKVPDPEITEAQADCVAFRTRKQLECVVDNRTKAEIDACRAGVQLAVDCPDGGWKRFLVARDGGAE